MATCNIELINLDKEKELNITVSEPGDKIFVQLIEGSAEIFGSELQLNEDNEFSYFSSVTVYTWHGCTMRIRKEASKYSTYKINNFKQISKMIDLHEYLEEFRNRADVNETDCPVSVIVGPSDAGKSTLCRFLLNYAVKHGRRPIFIDLDVGQGSLSITGTFGIVSVDEPSDIHGRFKQQTLSVYYYGYNSPGHNMGLYKLLLEKLGKTLKRRLCKEYHPRSSGVIINTCGWVDGAGYRLIKDIIKFLNVNIVFVLCENSLYHKLKSDMSYSTKVLRVPDNKGAVMRNKTVRMNSRNASLNEYFYGLTRQLQPYTIKVDFDNLQIFKANNSSKTSPYKCCTYEENSNLIPVIIEPSILYYIFGLSYAEHVEDVLLSSVYGFISIVDLDMDFKIATILSPKPSPLPTKYLLMGDIMLTQR